jgi:predicted nucleic acid-binding protein
VTVISDSSPLIALAKIDAFDLLQKLYGTLIIPTEVYDEIVVAGAGLAGAGETSKSSWIEVLNIGNHADLNAAQIRFGLGIGELSTILLAREIRADLVILDDLAARRLAQRQGFRVHGSVAILEASFRKGYLTDLRRAYRQLVERGVYLNRQLLDLSLSSFNLPPL